MLCFATSAAVNSSKGMVGAGGVVRVGVKARLCGSRTSVSVVW